MTTFAHSDHNPDNLRRRDVPVFMSGNLPPDVPETFDKEYRAALHTVLSEITPSALIGAHQYRGSDRDRAAGADFTARRLASPAAITDGVAAAPSPDQVVVASGTQSILTVLLSALVPRGGVLAVEQFSYHTIRAFSAMLGFETAAVAMDDQGIVPDALSAVCRTRRPAALYVTPTLHSPTTATMSIGRRRAIAAVCRHFGVQVIEDDIYSLLPPQPPPPLSAYVQELSWYVLGTAKSVASGLKVAYAVAPDPETARARFWPGVRTTYWMCAPINAAVATRLVEGGGAATIIEAVRTETRARQELVRSALTDIPYRTTPECLHAWLPLPPGRTAVDFTAAVRAGGTAVGASDTFFFGTGRAPDAVRLGIGAPPSRASLRRGLAAVSSAYHQ